jgi:eukaryotic-like serine/threonine-protein kinase
MFPSEQPPRALEGFDVLERIGAGGVGEVFLARSRGGKLVAIKTFVDARRDADEASGAAFVREASVCARLRHPCIVQVRAFLDEPGFSALVFEYVPGVALARVLRLCAARGVRLPDRPAWHVVERVLAALAYAHAFRDERGQPTPIVHRDVSPSNVLLDWTGGVKIADFGIAKVLGVSPSTRVGLVKGTLGCMAPEQARGDAVDERADVYAAGLLAWRLATGRVPFAKHGKDEIELLRAMRNPRIKPLGSIRPDLPEPLVDAVSRALEPEPERRRITAAEFADAVRSHVDVGGGWLELASLLEKWQGALQRTVKRAPGRDTTESSGRVAHTMRYEEAALLFDDDASPDGPTFEAHALPSDGAEVAPDALADLGAPASSFALPPAPVADSSPAPPIREALAPQAHRAGAWRPAAAILLVLATAALLAVLLATYAR